MLRTIDADAFMTIVVPLLEKGDPHRLAQAVNVRWRPRHICGLLQHEQVDVRKVAAVTLGFVGDRAVVKWLAQALCDEDALVNQMAEHGLWSIWFRSGGPHAAKPFREGIALLGEEAYSDAVKKFQEAMVLDPQFSEAHNQCAIAHFFLSQWVVSIDEARSAVDLTPFHFGAIAGMGHCYTQLGDLQQAKHCYLRALKINPRMPAIARAIKRLEKIGHPARETI